MTSVLVPATNALAGTLKVNSVLLPRYVPIVRLRELGWLDGLGFAELNELTEIAGRPPAMAAVRPIRTVCAATWFAASVNRIVVGLFTATHCAAGNPLAALPTVNVTGPQLALRLSDGCIEVRLGPFL